MAIAHSDSKRKKTGKRYKKVGAKKVHELGREPSMTNISERRVKPIRSRGNNRKYRLFSIDVVNVTDTKTQKTSKAKINSVLENPANRNYVRRNILTKGAVIDTDKGKVKITSRPGQTGTVNAVLVE